MGKAKIISTMIVAGLLTSSYAISNARNSTATLPTEIFQPVPQTPPSVSRPETHVPNLGIHPRNQFG